MGRRLAAGATVSFAPLGRQQLFSASPYLAAYPVRGERHGWFLQAGPQLLHLRTPSPVPEWKGTHSSSFGAELSSGYEYRANVLLRAYAMAAAGKGGLAPWVGFTLGWTF